MAFRIEIEFLGGLSSSQQSAFGAVVERWEKIITGDLPTVRFLNRTIDGVLIFAQGVPIDRGGTIEGNILEPGGNRKLLQRGAIKSNLNYK